MCSVVSAPIEFASEYDMEVGSDGKVYIAVYVDCCLQWCCTEESYAVDKPIECASEYDLELGSDGMYIAAYVNGCLQWCRTDDSAPVSPPNKYASAEDICPVVTPIECACEFDMEVGLDGKLYIAICVDGCLQWWCTDDDHPEAAPNKSNAKAKAKARAKAKAKAKAAKAKATQNPSISITQVVVIGDVYIV